MQEVFIVTRTIADWSKSTFCVLHEVVRNQILGVYETKEEAIARAIGHHPNAEETTRKGHCLIAWNIQHGDGSERRAVYHYKVGQPPVKPLPPKNN